MNQLILVAPYVALICSAGLIAKSLRFFETQPGRPANRASELGRLSLVALALPSLAQAQVNLQSSVESGNAIIMYLCGILAAVGILIAGVSMMAGRPAIAKWSFAGSMVSGLSFAIVKTMWSNFGLTAADVSSFSP